MVTRSAAVRAAVGACALVVASVAAGACSLLAPDDGALTGGARTTACKPGEKPCGDRCARIDDPATGCAAAGCEACDLPHAQAICVSGACAIGACVSGRTDCDADAGTGCEVDLQSSAGHCGDCQRSCGGASPRCQQATCVPRCGAVKLLGASARATFPGGGIAPGTGDFTLEAWVRWDGDFAGQRRVLLLSGALRAHHLRLGCTDAGAGHAACDCEIYDDSTAPGDGWAQLVLPSVARGEWHHVACVRASGTLRAYLDGALGGSAESDVRVDDDSGLILGDADLASLAAAVSVGPLRLSRVARYDAAFSPVRFWPVDGDTLLQSLSGSSTTGTTLPDESGTGHAATIETPALLVATDGPCEQ